MLSLTWLKLTSTPLALGRAIHGLQVARAAALASEGTNTKTASAIRAIFTSLSIRASPYSKAGLSKVGAPLTSRGNSIQPSEALPYEPGFVPGNGECASKGQQTRVTRVSPGPLCYLLVRIGGCQIRLSVLLVILSI